VKKALNQVNQVKIYDTLCTSSSSSPIWIILTDNVKNISFVKGKPGFSARNVFVLRWIVVEESSKPETRLPDQGLVLIRDQLERDRTLSHLLEYENLGKPYN